MRRRRRFGVDPATLPPRNAGLSRANRETLEWLDRQTPFIRCLVGFYGSVAVGDALTRMNPEDVPAALGHRAEFEREWESWSKIGQEKREALEQRKAQAARRLGF